MAKWYENIKDTIKNLNSQVTEYQKDTIIQSIPSLAYVNRAKKLIEDGKFAEAEKVLREAMALPQDDCLVYKYLGIATYNLGKFEEAKELYKKSSKLSPQDKDIWRLLGYAYLKCDEYEESEKAFEQANVLCWRNQEIHTGWGMALMKLKRLDEAHEKFIKAMSINPENYVTVLFSAITEMRLGMYDEAEGKLEYLINKQPDESVCYEYANLKYMKDDSDEALKYAQKSIEFNKNILPSYLLIAKVYTEQADIDNALKTYEQAYSNNLITPNLFYEWGITLAKFEKYDEAKEKFNLILELLPNEEDAISGIAMCDAALENIEQAKSKLEELLKEYPDKYSVIKGLAFVNYYLEDWTTAIQLFKQAGNLQKFDYICEYYIAKSYEKLGNKGLAKEYFKNSIAQNPNHIQSYLDYTRLLIKLEDFTDAQRKLRRALKIDENNLEILNLLFYVSYILVKQNISEYNVKETLLIAEKIYSIDKTAFKYEAQKADLEEILTNEKRKN